MHETIHPMKPLSKQDLETQDADTVRALAVEQSQLLVVATSVIRKLEKIVEDLTKELGAQNQRTLFAAQSLEKMRHLHFGRKSERREEIAEDSPLFSLFTQLSATTDLPDQDGNPSDSGSRKLKNDPIKRGRTPQPKLQEREVLHKIDSLETESRGLKPFEGQFEESSLITVEPSRLIIEHHRR